MTDGRRGPQRLRPTVLRIASSEVLILSMLHAWPQFFAFDDRRGEQIFLAFSCSSWSSLDPPLHVLVIHLYKLTAFEYRPTCLLCVRRVQPETHDITQLKRVRLDVSWDGYFVGTQVTVPCCP